MTPQQALQMLADLAQNVSMPHTQFVRYHEALTTLQAAIRPQNAHNGKSERWSVDRSKLPELFSE